MLKLVNLNRSVPFALCARPCASGPYTALYFLHEPGRGEPLEYALGRLEWHVEPLLQRSDRERNAWILNHAVNHSLHQCGSSPVVSSFLPHGLLPPPIVRQGKCRNKFGAAPEKAQP